MFLGWVDMRRLLRCQGLILVGLPRLACVIVECEMRE
jgi:hypothetical protein